MFAATLHEVEGEERLRFGSGDLLWLPVGYAPALRLLAGFDTSGRWRVVWQGRPAAGVYYWFDCWPQPWMGVTVFEELAFGHRLTSSRAREALDRLGLLQDGVTLDRPMLVLERFDALRVALARALLCDCGLLLMEQPDAGISDAQRRWLRGWLRDWLRADRSRAVAVTSAVDA
ncbi:MAG: hypothetical protein D6682_03190 [Zetaproteobacteria bacterium]|nr:MAG: hypothetical protein D6682_03190 [Zetaproteobacteria bacterium]